MNIAFKAMKFARRAHKSQARKYTGNPYADHLAEVAGIVATVLPRGDDWPPIEVVIATAWLHDCIEDQGISPVLLASNFGSQVAIAVLQLSDLEEGNRAERKRLSRERLANAPAWVQTIKVADLISNTSSIVQFDPDFAKVYLHEKRLLLDAMTLADARLVGVARSQIQGESDE